MTKIKGNNDGPGGRNETYTIGKDKNVSRAQAVRDVKSGKYSGAHVIKVNDIENVRDNPDQSESDNVNRNK